MIFPPTSVIRFCLDFKATPNEKSHTAVIRFYGDYRALPKENPTTAVPQLLSPIYPQVTLKFSSRNHLKFQFELRKAYILK